MSRTGGARVDGISRGISRDIIRDRRVAGARKNKKLGGISFPITR